LRNDDGVGEMAMMRWGIPLERATRASGRGRQEPQDSSFAVARLTPKNKTGY
jgi:hypothetical protein